MTCKLLVLISGNGSNLQALIDACHAQQLNAEIIGVVSNVPNAFGLERARRAGINTAVLDHKTFASRAEFDRALQETLQQFPADLIVLAGFMRILGAELVAAFAGRMLNIHPSLLPQYPGLHTHQRAIDAGDAEHGCTIHFVTADLDGGPLVAQSRCPVLPDDTAQTLADRVHPLEHALYRQVIAWYADSRLQYANGQAFLDNVALKQPVTV